MAGRGHPKTGGRKRGTKNKRTLARELAVAAAVKRVTAALGETAFEGDAHAVLIAVYRDAEQPIELRLEAARAAIGYEKPRLAAVEAKVAGESLDQLLIRSLKLPARQAGDNAIDVTPS